MDEASVYVQLWFHIEIRAIILPRIPSSGASTSMVALSVSCRRHGINDNSFFEALDKHTISSRTSPAINESPSFFFQDEMPPSFMVGDMAGISRLVMAKRGADE